MSPPTQSPTPPNPILCLVQSGTAERNVAGEEAHPLTGLNLTFMAAHFKQTLGTAAILLVNWLSYSEKTYGFFPETSNTALTSLTSPGKRKQITSTALSFLLHPTCLYIPYSLFALLLEVNRNHPSLQGQAAHLSSLTKDFVLPLFPSTLKVLCHRPVLDPLRSDFWPTSSFEGLL